MCLQGPPGLPGSNGVNGHNGLPGRDGRDGAKGDMGVAGIAGPRGVKGEPGQNGAKREKGVTGPPGPRGIKGEHGRDGNKGDKGVTGSPGPRGVKGELGPSGKDTAHRNWKQCAWKNDDGRNIGLIKVSFNLHRKLNLCHRHLQNIVFAVYVQQMFGERQGFGKICNLVLIKNLVVLVLKSQFPCYFVLLKPYKSL